MDELRNQDVHEQFFFKFSVKYSNKKLSCRICAYKKYAIMGCNLVYIAQASLWVHHQ